MVPEPAGEPARVSITVTRILELPESAALAAAEVTATAGGGPLPPPRMPNVVSMPTAVAIVAITPLTTFQPASTRASRRRRCATPSAAGADGEGARLILARVVEGCLSMIVAPAAQ